VLADVCPWIDQTIIDPGLGSGSNSTLTQHYRLLKTLRNEKYDAIITLYSTTRIGLLTFVSGAKYRLAPATKLAQLFYNHKLTQRRSKSLKPEYEYNLDLAIKYLNDMNLAVDHLPDAPFLEFEHDDINQIHTNFCTRYKINPDNKLIFVHPGTGGSATNLSLSQYAELIERLNISDSLTFVLTAGPGEINTVKELSLKLKAIPHVIYHSTDGLVYFSKLIQTCDLFISASTGPLHIAGALNRPTAAFYQRRRSATPLRWQTLNTEDKRLAFTPPESEDESDLHNIDIKKAAATIIHKFLQI
jgi:ADP-heptose:LPS heptosyltransferase